MIGSKQTYSYKDIEQLLLGTNIWYKILNLRSVCQLTLKNEASSIAPLKHS